MLKRFNRLYLRIWLAIVLALAVLSLLVLAAWRGLHNSGGAPMREVSIRNAQGELIGTASGRAVHVPGKGLEFQVRMPNGDTLHLDLPPPQRRGPAPTNDTAEATPDGSTPAPAPSERRRHMPPPWVRWGFATSLLIVAVAVALGIYPVVRRLTKRLEALHLGVQRLEQGDFSARVQVRGHDEVADLAHQFNLAASRIQSLMQTQRDLLANASHELRSPLTRLRMSLELIQGQPSPELRHEIQRSISELDELIDEILLASRLEAAAQASETASSGLNRQQDFEIVDLSGLAAEECAKVQAHLHIPGEHAIELSGSTKLLRRLLRNLLDNARRHIPAEGGEIHCVLQQDAQGTQMWVCDNGPGVPLAERERIFEAFYRPQGSQESQGNVGLGLALVRRIAQHHGGHVVCGDRGLLDAATANRWPIETQVCTGAVFHVFWPAKT